jgi:hypothetical protein
MQSLAHVDFIKRWGISSLSPEATAIIRASLEADLRKWDGLLRAYTDAVGPNHPKTLNIAHNLIEISATLAELEG